MATIRLVGYLKKIAGFKTREFDVKEPISIRSLVNFPEFPDDRLVVLVNEKGASLDDEIQQDDYVKILPVIGGG